MNPAFGSRIQAWCLRPTDLWDCATTTLLVRREWAALRKRFSWGPDDYNTAGYILDAPNFVASKRPIPTRTFENQIFLEEPSAKELNLFYKENHLSPVGRDEFESKRVLEKLGDAMKFLDAVPGVASCVAQLVRVIGVLESVGPEEDVSYSHPAVPFSIFVSVCNQRSAEASARVAESILHEAMHLRLSLIQNVVDLFDPIKQDGAQYFSPWRQEERPVNGVLHGIFVFRAILDFFKGLSFDRPDDKIVKHSKQRIQKISSELAQVKDFYKSDALSPTGMKLIRQLLCI